MPTTAPVPRRSSENVSFVDELLSGYTPSLGPAFSAYRNHVCRVVSLCELLCPLSDLDRRQVQVAACFHDLGIWTNRTFDYLGPSQQLAESYLEQQARADWNVHVGRIIADHHKLFRSRDRLAEAFRRADWIDVTQGTLRFGVPRARIRELEALYPKAGFHALLVKLTLRQMMRTPWKPLPMLRW